MPPKVTTSTLDVSIYFAPNVIGSALGKLWVVDGHKLVPRHDIHLDGDLKNKLGNIGRQSEQDGAESNKHRKCCTGLL